MVRFRSSAILLVLVGLLTAMPVNAQARFMSAGAADSFASGGNGTQAVRARLVQDDATVGGTFRVAIELRTEGLDTNTLGSATVDLDFDPEQLSVTGFEEGVLAYAQTPYSVSPSLINNGTTARLTITSSGVGTGGFDRDGYEVGSAYVPVLTYVFTIDAAFDEADFPIDCASLSVGYYESLDNASGNGVILDNSAGAVPMLSVRPLAVRTFDLTSDAGWRVLSGLPGMSLDDLLGPLTTQGFPGADQTGFSNVYQWEEAAGWASAASQSAELPATDGVAFLAFAEDLPASVRVAGAALDEAYSAGSPASCSAFPLAFGVMFTDGGAHGFEDGWNLVGNPTAYTLDWDAPGWTRSNLTNTLYVYDPESEQYLTWNGETGSLGDGLIAPLQGFWVKATTTTPQLVAPEAALTSGGTFYGRSEALAANVPASSDVEGAELSAAVLGAGRAEGPQRSSAVVGLRVEGEVEGVNGMEDRWAAAYVSFQPGSAPGVDRYDAEALAGLGSASLDLYTVVGSEVGEERALEIDARPLAEIPSSGALEIPLAFEATAGGEVVGGKFELTWPEVRALPPSVQVLLVDTETGTEVDLSAARSYRFEVTHDALRSEALIVTREKQGATLSAREAAAAMEHHAVEHHSNKVALGSGPASEQVAQVDSDPQHARRLSAPVVQSGNRTTARFLLRFARVQGRSAGTDETAATSETSDGVAKAGTEAALPEAFALESVYPNPFVSRATVRFALPEAADVRLVVYDLLGRQVAVLADSDRAAGYHTAVWDASDRPSGVYVLRLVAGSHAFTRRLTILR
ncbi:MAG: T9SS type A sorting domain-containing protein [Rhodothermales bacterium]